MKVQDSLTRRVTLAMSATVALFVGLMAVLAYSVMLEQEDELADQLVQLEMQRLLTRLDRGDVHLSPQPLDLGPKLEAWFGQGNASAAQPAELLGLADGPHEIHTGTHVLHALVTDSAHGRITVVFDATRNEQRVSEFGIILLALWAVCVAGGYWLARAVARIVVGPMREVTERIAGWDPDSGHAADARVAGGADEAGRLLEAFNRMQDRVDRSIAREREFAANLGHEVRTPLAGLRTDLELAALDGRTDAGQRQRFERMMRSIDDIGATIRAARAISRAESSSTRQTLVLAELVSEVWDSLRARGSAAGLQFANAVDAGQEVFANRYALLIVLRNLIANAIEHAAPAKVTIASLPHGVQVFDDGPGIAEGILPFVFDRHHHGRPADQGGADMAADDEPRGLGLAIARRVCEQQGWLLTVDSTTTGAQRGTCFSLYFDENST